MAIRRAVLLVATLIFTSSAFAKDVYLSITGTVGNFRTDARVFNPSGTKDITVSATFLPVGNVNNAAAQSVNLTIPKRQMRVLDDVVAGVFSATGLGAIRLSSSDDFVATARIYAQTATGTLGQFVPGLEPAQASAKGVLIQLKSSAAFRTNVGAVNPNATAANVTWRLYDKNNALIATGSPMTLQPFGVIGPTNIASTFFFTVPAGADLSDAWVSYQSDQPIFAYASVIDNATTDPTFIPALTDSGETVVTPPPTSNVKTYNVTVRSFEIVFSPALDIRTGDKVTFNLVNPGTDLHGFSVIDASGNPVVPATNVPGPNRAPVVRSFTAGAAGSYTAFCTQPSCGSGHDSMFTSFDVGGASGNGERPGY